jgi:hypothetical protein
MQETQPMFRKSQVSLAVGAGLAGLAAALSGAAQAQTAQRVEITDSQING